MGSHIILPACTSCQECVDVCPTESIFYGINTFVIDRDSCTDCRICVRVCPVNVIQQIQKQEKTSIDQEEED